MGKIPYLGIDLTSDVSLDPSSQFFTMHPLGEQKDQLGIESFKGHVMGADCSALREGMT